MTAPKEEFASTGQVLVEAGRALGTTPMATALRAWVVPQLFHEQERRFAEPDDPTPALVRCMQRCATRLRESAAEVNAAATWGRVAEASASVDVEAATGHHYGNLFAGFSAATYWDEPTALLRTRLERNGVHVDFADKTVIDTGCGGGRYTAAWRKLGAKHALGIDVSPLNIATAEARAKEAGLADVEYRLGNVLSLPVESGSFDIVFSNGVLHHTRDWRTGIGEMLRVLRPGGLGWLYLIERPGGLFWDMIDVLRGVMHGDSFDIARRALQLLELPQNRVFYMLDHVMAPINERLTPEQIETALREAGARDVRRLTRGADFDRVEQIHLGVPYAEVKFGVGENRYIFTR